MPAYIAPYGLIVMRVWGATLLFVLMGKTASSVKIDRSDYKDMFLSALTGVGANMLLFFQGLALTTPIKAAVEMVCTPLFVALLAFWVLKERATSVKLLGLVLGLSGAVLMILYPHFTLSGGAVMGDICVILNAIIYAYYLIIAKPLILKYQALAVVKWTFILGAVIVFPFGISDLIKVDWAHIPFLIWMAIAFVIICTTFLTYFLNGWALKYVNSSVVGAYIYLQPVLASIIAISLGKDELNLQKIIFAAMIFAGVYLVSIKPKPAIA